MKNKKLLNILTLAIAVVTLAFLVLQFLPLYAVVNDEGVTEQYSVAGMIWLNTTKLKAWGTSIYPGKDVFNMNKAVTGPVFAAIAGILIIALSFRKGNSILNFIASWVLGIFGSVSYLTSSMIFITKGFAVTEEAYFVNHGLVWPMIVLAFIVLILVAFKTYLMVPEWVSIIKKNGKKFR